MKVEQIYTLMNSVSEEVLGTSDIIQEDLSGIVDMGTAVFNQNAMDNYVRSLVNHIGKVIFVNRPYQGTVPSVLLDAWEFGSVLQKVTAEIPKATENDTWDLEDQEVYNQDMFHQPKVTAKFFNSRVTFEVPMSITERQVKESFSSAEQLNGFLSMLYDAVDKSMTIKTDALVMRTINSMIANTLHADAEDFTENAEIDYSIGSTTKSVNLLKLYNDKFDATLAPEEVLTSKEFMRFASYTMGIYTDRMRSISTLFNIGGKERFSSDEYLHVVLLSDFAKSAGVYLYGDTFNKNEVTIPKAETVPYWQGSGKAYEFGDISKVDVKLSSTLTVEADGILGVMFDRDALGVSNLDRRVTSNYNAKAEFFNNYYKFEAGYFNDTNENFIVFFVA